VLLIIIISHGTARLGIANVVLIIVVTVPHYVILVGAVQRLTTHQLALLPVLVERELALAVLHNSLGAAFLFVFKI
jgi:hypothetical protein